MKNYLQFDLIESKPKTDVYAVINTQFNQRLGVVKWYASWRQYCFFPDSDTLYHKDCLREIANFIKRTMDSHVEKRQEVKSGHRLENCRNCGKVLGKPTLRPLAYCNDCRGELMLAEE
jgi:hypothetical protein